jgi:hypothetical protein
MKKKPEENHGFFGGQKSHRHLKTKLGSGPLLKYVDLTN